MRKFVRNILLIVNIVLVLILVASYPAANINPNESAVWSPLGIVYPQIAFANLFFILFWLFFKKRFALLSLGALLLGWPRPKHLFQINSTEEVHDSSKAIKLLSYNVRLFNKYDWSKDNTIDERIFEFLDQQNADLYCFQEFYDKKNKNEFLGFDLTKKATETKYLAFENMNDPRHANKDRFFGLSIFSKYPVIKSETVFNAGTKARAIYADILFHTDTLRVYNVHLKSLGFNPEEYAFIKDVTQSSKEEQIEQSKGVLKKLFNTFKERADEANYLKAHINNSPYPVILMGDFNETPYGFAYNTISKDLQDAFILKGNGTGASFEGFGVLPSIQIDHMLLDNSFNVRDFTTFKIRLSDHEPISGTVELK